MASKTTTMTKAALQKEFGIPGGPGGQPVKKKQPPKGKFNKEGQVFVDEPPVKGNYKPPVKPEPTLSGPLYITPAVEGQRGKRRAPSLSMDTPTKKGATVRAGIENLMKYGSSTFQSSDVESEDAPAEGSDGTGDPLIDTATREDIRQAAIEINRTRANKDLEAGDQLGRVVAQQDYMRLMEESLDRRLQGLEFELRNVEEQQAGMDECDTSFFTPEEAQYYNDYADYLEERKNDLESEIESLDTGTTMKKAPTKKRASSARSKPRPKTRRVAVKRGPVKARRRKSTSSGRRSPGSPARSR